MTENIIRKCDLFAANKNKIHRKFKWDYHLMSVLSSMVYTMENKEADPDRMRECLKTVKKNTGAFSPFRSSDRLFLVSKMALSEDPERVIAVYDAFRSGHRKYSKEYGLASLGAFTGSSKDPAALAAEIIETESYLATKKGMGPTVMNRTQRLLFAALIVADCEGSAGNAIKNPIIVETIQTIIAMEMMTMVVAVTAASSASR